ncbi:hypothetical protein [Piscirickettsia litoralis]|uniref:DUF1638 domain-containing protein n=1 Tax=Piscirickettsia litoralis TaxID=1891921 RepID=A0ABX3A123_9GAMM|nr:hypothetical protein [Piscirickettsia litoralis]ODN42574.1 hypothetical protein BGC07_06055 [Piscirickettsia litoralis]
MYDTNDLVHIALVISHLSRSYIPSSSNLKLIEEDTEKTKDLEFLKSTNNVRTNVIEQKPTDSIFVGYGTCGYLSFVMRYIARQININGIYKPGYNIYLTNLGLNGHVYCLLHTSKNLYEQQCKLKGMEKLKLGRFYHLATRADLKNAIIVDPWIYKVTPLTNWKNHIAHAGKI